MPWDEGAAALGVAGRRWEGGREREPVGERGEKEEEEGREGVGGGGGRERAGREDSETLALRH